MNAQTHNSERINIILKEKKKSLNSGITWPLNAWLCEYNVFKCCFPDEFPLHHCNIHTDTDGYFRCKYRQDFCYLNLQIHHLHEQEAETDERFEWIFPRHRLTPKKLTSIPCFKADWTVLERNSSTCLKPLAKTVQIHKLLLLLLFPSPDRARLHIWPIRALYRHAQAPASSQTSSLTLGFSFRGFSSASPILILQLHPACQPTSLPQYYQIISILSPS